MRQGLAKGCDDTGRDFCWRVNFEISQRARRMCCSTEIPAPRNALKRARAQASVPATEPKEAPAAPAASPAEAAPAEVPARVHKLITRPIVSETQDVIVYSLRFPGTSLNPKPQTPKP